MLRYSQDSFSSSSLSSFYLPNNTTVGTYASLQLSRAGQQGPTRTLTAALERLIKHLLDIHSTTRVQFWAQLYRDTSLSRWNLLIKARVVHGSGLPMGWVGLCHVSWWVGLDRVTQNGPVDNSDESYAAAGNVSPSVVFAVALTASVWDNSSANHNNKSSSRSSTAALQQMSPTKSAYAPIVQPVVLCKQHLNVTSVTWHKTIQ